MRYSHLFKHRLPKPTSHFWVRRSGAGLLGSSQVMLILLGPEIDTWGPLFQIQKVHNQ